MINTGMPEFRTVGKGPVKAEQHVMNDVGIGIFVDRNAGSRVRAVHDAEAVPDAAFPHRRIS
jgi:hypothetical protein